MRAILVSALVVLAAADRSQAAIEATALFKLDGPQNTGIWISHYPSQTLRHISKRAVNWAYMAPDGRRILLVTGDSLHVMNNNGTGLRAVCGGSKRYGAHLAFTSNGIFHIYKEQIYRINIETGVSTIIPPKLTDLAPSCAPSDQYSVFGSADGRVMWVYIVRNLPDKGGCDNYDRGVNAFLTYNADFTTYQIAWRREWGHGRQMSQSGKTMHFMELGGHRRHNPIVEIKGTETAESPLAPFEPPVPAIKQDPGDHPRCANNDSIWGYEPNNGNDTINKPFMHNYFYNIYTRTLLGDFVEPQGDSAGKVYLGTAPQIKKVHFCDIWYGPLPGGDDIYLEASTLNLTFLASDPSTKTFTVRNTSSVKHLGGPLTVTVTPASATWLTATVQGTADTQTVTVSIDRTKMSGDVATAKLTVSGQQSVNTVEVTVTAYKSGSTIAIPVLKELAATGDSLLDVQVTWEDVSNNETGFVIERRKDGVATWTQAGAVGANVTTFLDLHVGYGKYYYRIKATGASGAASAFTGELGVNLIGIEWVRITSPIQPAYQPGASYTVRWTVNLITQVKIQLSTDGGISFGDLTPDGGIVPASAQWSNFSFTMPAQEAAKVYLRVADYNDRTYDEKGPFAVSSSSSIKRAASLTATGAIRMLGDNLAVTVAGDQAWTLRLTDCRGAAVRASSGRGSSANALSLRGLAQGVYVAHTHAGAVSLTELTILK